MDSSGSIVKDPPAAAQRCESWAEWGQPGWLNIPDTHAAGRPRNNGVLHFICMKSDVEGGSESTSRLCGAVFISGTKEDGRCCC